MVDKRSFHGQTFPSQIIKVLKNAYNTPLNIYQLSDLVLIIIILQ